MFDVVRDRELLGCSERRVKKAISGNVQLLQRMTLQRKLRGHSGCVNACSFDPDAGALLITGSDDQQVLLWDWQQGVVRLRFDSGHSNNVFQARMLPHSGGSRIITCAADGQVRLAELPEGASSLSVSKTLLATHEGRAHKLALDPLNPQHCFYSSGEDGQVIHYDLRCGLGVRQPGSGSSSSGSGGRSGARRKLLVCCGYDRTRGPSNRVVGINAIHVNPLLPWQFAVGGCDPWARVYDARKTRDLPNPSLDPNAAALNSSSSSPPSLAAAAAAAAAAAGFRDPAAAEFSAGAMIGPPTRQEVRESRVYAMADEPVVRLCPEGLSRVRTGGFGSELTLTCVMYSRQGELLASYNDEDIYLFSAQASRGALGSSSSGRRTDSSSAAQQRAGSSSSGDRQQQQQQQRTSPLRRSRAAVSAEATAAAGGSGDDSSHQQQQQEGRETTAAGGQQQQQQRQGLGFSSGSGQSQEGEEEDERPRWRRRQQLRPAAAAAAEASTAGTASSAPPAAAAVAGVDAMDTEPLVAAAGAGSTAAAAAEDGARNIAAAASERAAAVGSIIDDGDGDREMQHESSQQQQQQQGLAAGPPACGLGRGFGIPAARFFDAESSSRDGVVASYYGHRNSATVKGVAFFGEDDEYVMSGSDCGHVFIWSKAGGEVVWWAAADEEVVNCLEPHPLMPHVMATSGIEHDVKVWGPTLPAPQPPPPTALRGCMASNRRDREAARDALSEPEQWLMALMAAQRRRARAADRRSAAATAAGTAAAAPAAATDEQQAAGDGRTRRPGEGTAAGGTGREAEHERNLGQDEQQLESEQEEEEDGEEQEEDVEGDDEDDDNPFARLLLPPGVVRISIAAPGSRRRRGRAAAGFQGRGGAAAEQGDSSEEGGEEEEGEEEDESWRYEAGFGTGRGDRPCYIS